MKKILLFIGCSFVFVLSACFPTGSTNDSPSDTTNPNDSKSITPAPGFIDTELDKNLIVQADVVEPAREHLKIRTIHLKEFDQKQIENVFLKNRTVVNSHENNNEYFPNYKDQTIEFEDGSYVRKELGKLIFNDIFYQERFYDAVISDLSFFIRSDIKDVFQKDSLDNIDKNQAIETVKNIVKELGISSLGNAEVYALDLEGLSSQWEDFPTKSGESPRKWEKEDEAYLVAFPVVYDNVRITTKGYVNEANAIPAIGSRIMGVVNKNGLIHLTCTGIYEVGKTVKENITAISVDSALEIVKNKYKDVLLTVPIRISHIALEYVPTVSNNDGVAYQLVPAWVFTAHQKTTYNDPKKGAFEDDSEFTIIINAETGKEIRIGGEQ